MSVFRSLLIHIPPARIQAYPIPIVVTYTIADIKDASENEYKSLKKKRVNPPSSIAIIL